MTIGKYIYVKYHNLYNKKWLKIVSNRKKKSMYSKTKLIKLSKNTIKDNYKNIQVLTKSYNF